MKGSSTALAPGTGAHRGSITDFVANLKTAATVDDINAAYKAAAEGSLEGRAPVRDGAHRVERHRHHPYFLHLRQRPHDEAWARW